MQLLPYFSHSCLVFVLSPSSFIILLLFKKLAGATYADPKEAGIECKLQWQAVEIPNDQWSV
jgi:hypothetical protein